MIAIVDYGMGNVRSLRNALEYLGSPAVVTSDERELANAERVVLPGVGAFGDAMRAIRERGLDEKLRRHVIESGKPLLGVCLGMQLLAKTSDEHGEHAGLGWLDATVERFDVPAGFKVPHVGWNDVQFADDDWLFRGIRRAESNFYFVHSHHVHCHDSRDVAGTARYGQPFTAAVRRGHVCATQFHPEKSQDNGIRVLGNFLQWKP